MNLIETGLTVTPPTFPARPINGGPWNLAPPKMGDWWYEPKYNERRALIHVPTGIVFNRHGKLVANNVTDVFRIALFELQGSGLEWLDCGLFYGRDHKKGRGTIMVFDILNSEADYEARRELLGNFNKHLPWHPLTALVHYPCSYHLGELDEQISELWELLQKVNEDWDCPFYEGLVAKLAHSLYPFQNRNSTTETPDWVKHRFL